MTKLFGPAHPDTLRCLIQLGSGYGMRECTKVSAKLSEESLPICGAKSGPQPRERLQCLNNLVLGSGEIILSEKKRLNMDS